MNELDLDFEEKLDKIIDFQNEEETNFDSEKKDENFYDPVYELNENSKESLAYRRFYKEYKKLYSNNSYDNICRIDKILDLFNDYLYVNGEICVKSNISLFDYVKISLYYFDFLYSNYSNIYSNEDINMKELYELIDKLYYEIHLFEKSKEISKMNSKLIELEQEKLFEIENNEDIRPEEYQNEYEKCQDTIDSLLEEDSLDLDHLYEISSLSLSIHEKLPFFWNPFNKKMVDDLIKLYYIVKDNIQLNKEIKCDLYSIQRLIVDKCILFDKREELFDFLAVNPEAFRDGIIDLIYDTNSANIVLNILNLMEIKYNNCSKKLDYFYNRIMDILKKSKSNIFQNDYNEYKNYQNVFNNQINILEKIKVFNLLYTDIFFNKRILGTYSNSNFCYLINDEEKQDSSFDDLNFDDIDFDNIEIDSLSDYLRDVEEKKNIFHNLEKSNKNKDYFAGLKLLNNGVNPKDVYDYYSDDYITENQLRTIYQEMMGFFDSQLYIISSFKDWEKQLLSIDYVKSILDEYEIKDLSEEYDKEITSTNYDSEQALKYLIKDLNELNVQNSETISNRLLEYSKVKKVLLTASNLWHIFESTQNMNIDKDGQDYTPLVANYFKSVELLLYRKIKDSYNNLMSNDKKPLPIYKVNGEIFNINNDNDNNISLGEMEKYIRREKNIVLDYMDNNALADKIKLWTTDVRNSNLHKDIISSKSKAIMFKNKTLLLLVDILYYFEK